MVAVAEGQGPVDSLRESYALVRGHWWQTFAVFTIVTAATTLMSLASNEITLVLADLFDSNTVSNAVSTLTYVALLTMIWPLGACLMYGVYQDLRLRQNE